MAEVALDDWHAFAGRVALVTGAGRGIGKSIAVSLAARGAAVVVVARSGTELEGAVDEIERAGGRAHPVRADLADLAGIGRLAEQAAAPYGPIDVLVNNAATVGPLGPTASLDWQEVRGAFDLNVVSVVALTAAMLPSMVERGWGRVVNVSSGIVARPGTMRGGTTYTATKGALEAQTVNLAAELEGTGVTVNVYRPGTVDTAMQAHIRDQDPERVGGGLVQRFQEMRESGSLVTPEESARDLVARLAGVGTGGVWSFGA